LDNTIQRSPSGQSSSSLGAAISAGIGAGIWVKKEELQDRRKNIEIFHANKKNDINKLATCFEKYLKNTERDVIKWNRAIQRCMNWYE
jgi:glycerol kinase